MRMRLLVVLLLCFLPGVALGASLADRVPDDVVLCVTWRGADALAPQYKGSHLEGFVKAANLQSLWSDTLPKLLAKAPNPEAKDAGQLALDIAAILWKHPTAFCVGPVDFTAKDPQPEVAVLCEAADDAPRLIELVKKAIASGPPNKDAPPLDVHTKGDAVVITIGKIPASHAAYFGTGKVDIDIVATKPLSASAKYKQATGQLQAGADAAYLAYVDVAGIVTIIDGGIAHEHDATAVAMWPKVRAALNLDTFGTSVCAGGFTKDGWREEAFVGMGPTRNGLAMLMAAPPLADATIKAVPANSAAASMATFDLGKILAEARRVAGAIDPNGQRAIDQGLAQGSAILGLDVQKDFVDALGDQWAFYSSGKPITGVPLPVPLPNMNVINHLANPEKMTAAMAKLEALGTASLESAASTGGAAGSMHLKTLAINGVDVHYLMTPYVTPSWAVDRGNLIITLQPRDTAAAATQAAGVAAAGSIADNAGYADVIKRLDVSHPNMVQFVDLPKTAPAAYQTVQQILGLLQMTKVVEIDPTALPALEDIMPHLAPSGSASWCDEAGWHVRSVSPFPGSELLGGQVNAGTTVPMIAVGTAILIPSLGRAKELANRSAGAASLSGIGKACLLYSAEHNDALPDDLAQLIVSGNIGTRQLIDKSSHTPQLVLPEDTSKLDWHEIAKDLDAHCDFVYVGKGMKSNADSSVVLAYDKGMHREGRNVLFADCHVEFIKNAQLNEVFANSNKTAPNPLLTPLPEAELGGRR